MAFKYEEKVPNPAEFCEMRVKAKLSPKSLKAATIALPNSLYGISIRDGDQLIAMGRVILKWLMSPSIQFIKGRAWAEK